MLRTGIAIRISLSTVIILSMGLTWIALHQFIQAQDEPMPNNSSSTPSRTIVSNKTATSVNPLSFQKLINGACNITNTNKDEAVDGIRFLTYLNPYYGIAIQYPLGWSYKESETSPQDTKAWSMVTFFPPLSSDPNAETNFKVWVEKLNNPAITLEEYTRNAIKSYRDNNSHFRLVSGTHTNTTISNGFPAYELVFRDYSNNLQRKSIDIGTINNASKSAYYMTFNTDASLYDKFNPLLKKMVSSFRIYNNPSAEDHDSKFIQLYNNGLEFMIRTICPLPVNSNENTN